MIRLLMNFLVIGASSLLVSWAAFGLSSQAYNDTPDPNNPGENSGGGCRSCSSAGVCNFKPDATGTYKRDVKIIDEAGTEGTISLSGEIEVSECGGLAGIVDATVSVPLTHQSDTLFFDAMGYLEEPDANGDAKGSGKVYVKLKFSGTVWEVSETVLWPEKDSNGDPEQSGENKNQEITYKKPSSESDFVEVPRDEEGDDDEEEESEYSCDGFSVSDSDTDTTPGGDTVFTYTSSFSIETDEEEGDPGPAGKDKGSCTSSCKDPDSSNGCLKITWPLGEDANGDTLGYLELFSTVWSDDLLSIDSLKRYQGGLGYDKSVSAGQIVSSHDGSTHLAQNTDGNSNPAGFTVTVKDANGLVYLESTISKPNAEQIALDVEWKDEQGTKIKERRDLFVHNYDQSSGERTWDLGTGLVPATSTNLADAERRVDQTSWETTDQQTGITLMTERRHTYSSGGVLAAVEDRVYRKYDIGDYRVVEWKWGTTKGTNGEPDGDVNHRQWDRYDDSNDEERYGKIRAYVSEDGYWEHLKYDDDGRLITVTASSGQSSYDDPASIPDTGLPSTAIVSEARGDLGDRYVELQRGATLAADSDPNDGIEDAIYTYPPAKVYIDQIVEGSTVRHTSYTIDWPSARPDGDYNGDSNTQIVAEYDDVYTERWVIDSAVADPTTSHSNSHKAFLRHIVDQIDSNATMEHRVTKVQTYKLGEELSSSVNGEPDTNVSGRTLKREGFDGMVTDYRYPSNLVREVETGWPGERRLSITEIDDKGRVISRESKVQPSSGTGWLAVSKTVSLFQPETGDPSEIIADRLDRQIKSRTHFGLDGTTGEDADGYSQAAAWQSYMQYGCCGIEFEIDKMGRRMEYIHDSRRQIEQTTRYAGTSAEVYQHFTYDAAGRVTSQYTETPGAGSLPPESSVYDKHGRMTSASNPLSDAIYYVYNDVAGEGADIGKLVSTLSNYSGSVYQETRVYPDHSGAWAGGSDTPPVQITWTDVRGNTVRTWTASSGASWNSSSKPGPEQNTAGQEVIGSGGGDLTELSRTEYVYDWAGRLTHAYAYKNLPTGYAASTNLSVDAVSTETEYDVFGQPIKQVDAAGNITMTIYDDKGRASEVWVGTDAIGATQTDPSNSGSNNMVKVSQYHYDTNMGQGSLGDQRSYATRVESLKPGLTSLAGTSADYVAMDTEIKWLDGKREVSSKPQDSLSPWSKQTYDTQGRLLMSESYANSSNSQGALIAKSENVYDDANSAPWKLLSTKVYEVNAGIAGNHIETSYGYDVIDRQVSTQSQTGAVTKSEYDGYGRMIRQYVVADNGSKELVVSETVYGYDDAGQVITTVTYDRLHDADPNDEDLLSAAPSLAEARYAATWYDEAGRVTHVADYGNVSP